MIGMTNLHLLSVLPLLAMMLLAAVIDMTSRRIPNWLSVPLLFAGIVQSFFPGHLVTPGYAMLGVLAGFGLTFGLFAIDAMGGGDVKFLSAVGAWVGPETVLLIFLVEAVVGMVIVLIQATATGRMKVLARNTAVVAINLIHIGELGAEHAIATGKECKSIDRPLPYAVPVLIATLLVFGLRWHGGLQ
jgi:prepilin peptidase CpaA